MKGKSREHPELCFFGGHRRASTAGQQQTHPSGCSGEASQLQTAPQAPPETKDEKPPAPNTSEQAARQGDEIINHPRSLPFCITAIKPKYTVSI